MGKCDAVLPKAFMDIKVWAGAGGSINCKANPDSVQVNFNVKNRMGARLEVNMSCSSYNGVFKQSKTSLRVPPIPGATATWSQAQSLKLTKTSQVTNTSETISCDFKYKYGGGSSLVPCNHVDLAIDL